jgi:hypothetical protein
MTQAGAADVAAPGRIAIEAKPGENTDELRSAIAADHAR